MTRISVDNQQSMGNFPGKNIGDILQKVLEAVPENRIVTDIILDGQQLAQHEDKDVLRKCADTITELQIRTTNKHVWATSGIDMALSCIDRVKDTLIHSAQEFRDDNPIRGNELFIYCADGLRRFVETIMLTKTALKLDFKTVQLENCSLAQIEDDLTTILKQIADHQKDNDFIEMADKVEYELIPNLCQWRRGLQKISLPKENV